MLTVSVCNTTFACFPLRLLRCASDGSKYENLGVACLIDSIVMLEDKSDLVLKLFSVNYQ